MKRTLLLSLALASLVGLSVALSPAVAGPGGGGGGARPPGYENSRPERSARPRVRLDFDHLDMTVLVDRGLEEKEISLADALDRAREKQRTPKPTVLWIYSTADRDAMDASSAALEDDEEARIALERFALFAVDVETIRNEKFREACGETPAYVFYDPKGREIGRVSGQRASEDRFLDHEIAKAWREVFDGSRRRYVSAMEKILDEKDRLQERRDELERERDQLSENPSPRREKDLDRKSAELEEQRQDLFDKQRELREELALKEEFREDANGGDAGEQ